MEFPEQPIGKILTEQDFLQDIADENYQHLISAKAIDFLEKTPSRSVLISGERGTGKSTIIHLISKKLRSKQWDILVAGALDIIAGQMYIGMLDGQIKTLVTTLSEEKSLWIIPSFLELYYSGKNTQDPNGILDRILPYIEKSNITVLAEINAAELEKILKFRPQLKTIIEIIRLEPLSQDSTLSLAEKWLQFPGKKEIWNNISEKELRDAFTFSKQFLGFSKEPGNFLNFLKLTQSVVETNSDNKIKKVTPDDFIFSLSAISGLPLSILDDRKKLNIEDLRQRFSKRIIGQEEAAEAIIERIAMIKAGFTDSSRPLGIFLFVGPTGTGKTEIAKTLAEFLFGADDRMIRIDMSEFQTPDSLNRLIGSFNETESVSLVDEIRRNPFSVVLLDEFEKANPNIWNLFLQLFDDARLTDLSGNTADFRHAIIIMTSNLGSSIPTEPGIGFGNVIRGFDPQTVTKSLYKTFKPEFINRIDRIITFNPLSKTTMRQILKNELSNVLQRRGFRQRQWAVEWDESAIEFLLEKGFSAELGARPMKRAIEQYLLAPLAMTIVTNQFPQGDQFLFITRNGNNLKADFIDPDAPGVNWKEQKKAEEAQHEKEKKLTLKKIAFEPQGILAEVNVLQKELDNLIEKTEEKRWKNRKESLLLQMNEPEFWHKNDYKKNLSEIEYRDRFEQSLSTVASIMERFSYLGKKHSNFSAQLINQVAERILLMQQSLEAFNKDITQDAAIKILYEPSGKETASGQLNDFWEKLSRMYMQWAKERKMAYEVIVKSVSSDRCEFIMSIEGFAAYQVLEKEKGIHIWEQLKNENKYERIRVRVDVRTLSPEEISNKEILGDIVKKIFESPAANLTRIVRRYRNKPSPLVRDDVTGWRSGKIEKILDGNFDLVE